VVAKRHTEPSVRSEPSRAVDSRLAARDVADAAFDIDQGSFESEQKVLSELRSMRGMLRDQLSQMAWSDSTRRDPVRGKQFARLLSAGFSAVLARALLEKMPNGMDEAVANEWVQQAMVQNLRVVAPAESMIDKGGVYALVGPTGVGKTTTVAKLAARAAAKYGVRSIGMITVDHYRIGAHEQLRNYGKMMGCPVHLAHDAETLAELIHGMRGKHLILIDTIGAAQRDPKLNDQLSVLMGPGIERVLVVNAVSQIESLEEVVSTWRGPRCTRAVITKIDEAVKLGGAVDVCIRHKLSLDSVANGQRVPEDLHAANAGLMVHRALKQSVSPIFSVRDEELKSLMLHTATPAMAGGRRA
jgi:flagellar biosynthesis protein FlhF